MTPRLLLVLTSVALAPGVAWAQTPPADSLAERYHQQVLAIRDTLTLTLSSIEAFRRDLASVGAATVIGRARRATQRCEATRGYLDRASANLQAIGASDARVRVAVREYANALRELGQALREHCERGLAASGPGERADTLRAWGAYRASQLERAFVRQTEAAHRLARAANFRIEPRIP